MSVDQTHDNVVETPVLTETPAPPPVVETPTPEAPKGPQRPEPVLTASITKTELFDKGWDLPDFIVSMQQEADEKGVVVAEVDFDKTTATFHYRGYAERFPIEADGANL